MNRPEDREERGKQQPFSQTIGEKSARKQRAQRQKAYSVWHGLGTMGMVGWSVALPTLLGALLGAWLDATQNTRVPWTVVLLGVGLVIGCVNAWNWIERERQAMERDKREAQNDVNAE